MNGGEWPECFAKKEFIGWERKIAKQIGANSENLAAFRKMNFETVNLVDFKQEIIKTYDSFNYLVERVAATKILHIICPNFFPLWDNAIAKAVKAEILRVLSEDSGGFIERVSDLLMKKVKEFSGNDYYVYMQVIQHFVEKYKQKHFLNWQKLIKKGWLRFWMIFYG